MARTKDEDPPSLAPGADAANRVPAQEYGSLGAVVAFLMWLFLSAYVLLLGAELDAEMERQTVRDTTDGPEKPMGRRGGRTPPTPSGQLWANGAHRGNRAPKGYNRTRPGLLPGLPALLNARNPTRRNAARSRLTMATNDTPTIAASNRHRTPCGLGRIPRGRGRFARGFTLIELLTVIAIIGVLAGILIPVVGMVRAKAQASASVSNLRQIFLALSLFADEHRDLFPKATDTVDWDIDETDPAKMAWTQQLRPYSADQKFFLTPRFEREGSAYFLGARAAYLAAGGTFAATNRARIQFPSQFVLAGETNYPFGEPDYDKDDYTQNCVNAASQTLFADGSQAILFADGHVSRVKGYDAATMTFRYDTIAAW